MLDHRLAGIEASMEAAIADPARLAAVERTGLLDSPPEESFDRLTRLAAKLTGAPATFVTLVARDRDFYKSQCGFGEPLATSRELGGRTFCRWSSTTPPRRLSMRRCPRCAVWACARTSAFP